jgi:hypothetical protein
MAKVENTTFKAVGDSDERLHGHPAIIVAGHPAAEQVTVKAMLVELLKEREALREAMQRKADETSTD